MCRRKTGGNDWNEVVGRRVIPNLLSKDLFHRVKFFAHSTEEEKKQRLPWLRKARVSEDNHEQWTRKYCSNQIKTTRYTWWNFVPIALFLQFTKVVNVFYLLNMILQMFPQVRTNAPENIAIVLSTLILIGMIKEGLADYKRYKTDKASNAA